MTTVILNTTTRRVEVFSSARDVQARADILALDASLSDVARSGSASDLTSGTVPDGRMPSWAGYTVAAKAALQAANVPATVNGIVLVGFAAAGDGGGALYKRVGGEPGHAGKIQSADGAWWELVDPIVNVPSMGAVGDGVTDNAGAFADADGLGRLSFIPKTAAGYVIATPVATAAGAWLPDPTLSWTQLGSGNLDLKRGFYSNQLDGSNIWRLADRVFIGEAATHNAGIFSGGGGGDTWIATANAGPEYLARSAQLLVSATSPGAGLGGVTAITALGRTSDIAGGAVLGVAAAIVNDKAGGNAWGFISEMQREAGAEFTANLETDSKNKGDDRTDTPYLTSNGAYGLWIAAGGDDTFGGASANPSNTAITILKHADPAHGWNKGIVFKATALTGSDGVTGTTAVAIEMAKGHIVRWRCAAGIAASIRSDVDAIADASTLTFFNKGVFITGGTSKRYFQASYPTDVVNFTHLIGSIAGEPVQFAAAGDDTNVDLRLTPKGSGVVRFGAHAALGAETVTGYITIRDAGNTLRKLAVVS